MKISKSTRHSKIAGDFGETLVLYWLSKYGFECAKVDHTGIDLIALNPHTNERMGISVKSRTRSEGTEKGYVRIPKKDFRKVEEACKAFGCKPYFAVMVDAGDAIRVFITSMSRIVQLYPPTRAGSGWRMSPDWLSQYAADREIMAFELRARHGRWWKRKI